MLPSSGADSQPPDDRFARLITAARGGDHSALGELLQECREYLLLVANQDLNNQLRPKLGASDLVQESLLTAQVSFDQFEGNERSEMLAWVRQILKHDILEAHRHFTQTEKRQIKRESPIDDSRRLNTHLTDREHTPSTQAAIDEEAQLLDRAMADLPEDYQQVLRLRNWEKLTYAQIGQQTGRSEEAARKLWGRAILSLKNRLQSMRT